MHPRPLHTLLRLPELPLVVLLQRLLNGADGVDETSVAHAAILQRDGGALRADEPLFLQLTDIFRNGVAAHAHGLADGAVAGVALVGGAVFAVHEKRVHSDFAGGTGPAGKGLSEGGSSFGRASATAGCASSGTSRLPVYPAAELFLGDDDAIADAQGREALFVHELVGTGEGDAQELGRHFCVEEQRKLVVVGVVGSFHKTLLISNSEKKNLRFGGLSVRLVADGVCVFRSAACRRTVAAVRRLSF